MNSIGDRQQEIESRLTECIQPEARHVRGSAQQK